ncbi:MAG TPA: hypothetical protein VG293_00165 [Solirubrobacteraceae bacterium]|nr:hypothetical protein [Solirubrobacteraceae bacterium]
MVVAGCGGGSAKSQNGTAQSAAAHRVLAQSFDGHHAITSGVLTLDLKVVPRGSSTITGPIEAAFGGPFMNQGAGKLPESDFTISISAEGHRGALQVISANGKGYITVGGQSYRMPSASFRSLESGFGSLASSGAGSSAKSGVLSSLGIKPLKWLLRPRIVGRTTVGGVATTRVRAGLDTAAMLRDLSRLLGRTGSLGISGAGSLPHSISSATQRSIARALGSPSFNLWSGVSDRLIRRLTVSATVPVTGSTRTALGGMRSAAVTFGFEYSHVNQPQTISVPTATRPYSVFRAQVSEVLQEIESVLLTGSLGAGSGTTTSSASGGSTADRKYTQCITAAHGDVAKMQKCSKLLATG